MTRDERASIVLDMLDIIINMEDWEEKEKYREKILEYYNYCDYS